MRRRAEIVHFWDRVVCHVLPFECAKMESSSAGNGGLECLFDKIMILRTSPGEYYRPYLS
jgi:hypothetical protein